MAARESVIMYGSRILNVEKPCSNVRIDLHLSLAIGSR